MATMPPPDAAPVDPSMPPDAGGVPYPPEFTKAADAAEQALGQMFKICHQQEPDSPLCDALQNMMKAVAEIEARAGMGGLETPAEMPVEEPVEAPPEPAPGMMGGNPDMAAAAADVAAMMRKRPPGA